jgi:predicted DNA-binding transcriptional regulator AlpA
MDTIVHQHILSEEQFRILMEKIENIVPEKKPEDEIMGSEELQAFLNSSRTTIYNYMNKEGLPYHKVPGKLFFFKSEVLQWLKTK